jgi:hypothetical protein
VRSLKDSIEKLRGSLSGLLKRGGSDEASASPGSGGKFDPKLVLAWVKTHPVIVASVAVMLLVPVTAWWFASDIHAASDEAASKRAQEMAALEKLEKSTVEISLPGVAKEQKVGVVNEKAVKAYEQLAQKLHGDAVAIQRAALDHNQGSRKSLFVDITRTAGNTNTIAETVFDAVRAQAAGVLKEVRAGMPPSDESLTEQLQRRQDQFIATLRKADRKSLSEDELQQLKNELRDKRLQLYADSAANFSFYADINTIGLPGSPMEAGSPPSETNLFLWQWREWIIEDLLRAAAAANKPYRAVGDAPVKRVLSIAVREDVLPKVAAPAAEAAADAGAEEAAGNAAPPASIPPIDLKAPVTYDFTKSITGRVSNNLYDVRVATVRMVVASSMLPEVLNAIARQNFMTVTGLEVGSADAFAAADEGFIYGAKPVCEIKLTVESIWLRPWLAKLMPRELRERKGTDGRTTDDSPAEAPAAAPAT